MLILGIETTCDETGAAIVEARGRKNPSFRVLSNIVFSQIKDHSPYGGVVPNLAARLHLQNIFFILKKAFSKAGIGLKEIDLITVAHGPGLAPALFVGVETAKTLSYLLKKPLLGINHLEGHIYINWLAEPFVFPALGLLVSGGHTMLILIKRPMSYRLLGQTKDDAVGESFDKVARLLGLGYPGGPLIEKAASQYQGDLFPFPRPLMGEDSYDFSFSGLKTAVLYKTREYKKLNRNLKLKIAASFQEAVIDVLVNKTVRATQEYHPSTVLIGGGVAANKTLLKKMKMKIAREAPFSKFLAPTASLATDNAAMIAVAGYFNFLYQKKFQDGFRKLTAQPNLSLK